MFAILHVCEAEKLSILLAPTEILAKQHFDVIQNYFLRINEHTNSKRPLAAGLITGSVKQSDRTQIKALVKANSMALIVGTHAVLEDDFIMFLQSSRRLGLVVIGA